jgi:pimeloyl-ACP methyl ester carboxylesterase
VIEALATGAEARVTGERWERAVVCVNGGQSTQVPGTWSASIEWLVRRLAPQLPDLAFVEVRYRIKSWRVLDGCIADCRAAMDLAKEHGAREVVVLGFSMGGAVAIAVADDGAVHEVIGLAPWIPDRLDLGTLDGKRLAVIHGSLDAPLPGISGVTPRSSRRGYERALARGVEGSYAVVRGGLHGLAVRSRGGRLVPLPRAGATVRLIAAELAKL